MCNCSWPLFQSRKHTVDGEGTAVRGLHTLHLQVLARFRTREHESRFATLPEKTYSACPHAGTLCVCLSHGNPIHEALDARASVYVLLDDHS